MVEQGLYMNRMGVQFSHGAPFFIIEELLLEKLILKRKDDPG